MTVIVSILEFLAQQSWSAGLLAIMLIGLKCILGRRLSPKWHYALWLLVFVRLLMPAAPQCGLSISNYLSWERISDTWQVSEQAKPGVEPTLPKSSGSPVKASSPSLLLQWVRKSALQTTPLALWLVFPLWLLGAGVIIVMFVFGIMRSSRTVHRSMAVQDPEMMRIFNDCCGVAGVRRPPRLAVSPDLPMPALVGVLRPTILLPLDAASQISPEELRFVLLHELAHLRRNDIAVGMLASVLQALHWFNPLLWYATHRMRIERELACDASVMWAIRSDERMAYGRTILRMTERLGTIRWYAGSAGILENTSQARSRIIMIATPCGSSRTITIAALAAAMLFCSVTFTSARETKKKAAAKGATQVMVEARFLKLSKTGAEKGQPGLDLAKLAEQPTDKMAESLRKLESDGAVLVVNGPRLLVHTEETAELQVQRMDPDEHVTSAAAEFQSAPESKVGTTYKLVVTPKAYKSGKIHLDLKMQTQTEREESSIGVDGATESNQPPVKGKVTQTSTLDTALDMASGDTKVLVWKEEPTTGLEREVSSAVMLTAVIVKSE